MPMIAWWSGRIFYDLLNVCHHAWELPSCWDTENEFDSLRGELWEGPDKGSQNMIMNTLKIVFVPQSGLFSSYCIWSAICILRVKIKLESAFDVCLIICEITLKSPVLHISGSFVIFNKTRNFDRKLRACLGWPRMDSFWSMPIRCGRAGHTWLCQSQF